MKLSAVLSFALPLLVGSAAVAQDAAPSKVRVTDDHIEVLEPISFNSGKAAILASSNAVLDELAAVVKKEGERVAGIRIEGHTDNTGDAVFNAQLSDQRAHAVEKALIARGVDATHIVARGYGPILPIADNATNEGRAKNRRVEIVILSSDQLAAAKDSSLGRLSARMGVVELWKDGAFTPINVGTALNAGDKIRLAKGATADITLKDDTRLHLSNGAIFTLNAPADGKKYNGDGNLELGSLWVTLSELSLGRMFQINTTSASADVDIGEKEVSFLDGITSFSNFGGRPLWVWPAGHKGKATQVNIGKGGTIAADGRAKLAALPAAPTLEPLGLSRVAGPGLSFASWPKVAGAKFIHVVFGAGSAGLGRLTEITLPGDATFIDGSWVPGGWQWMSLQSENDAGMMSPLSTRRKVGVVKVNADSGFAAGETSTVSAGTKLSFAPPTLCSVDGGPPLAAIVLDKVGAHTITCTGPYAGGLGPWTVNVAAIELVKVAQTGMSPFKAKSRVDFELRSTAPLGKGLTFIVDGPSQYNGIEHKPAKPNQAWASFVPEDGKLPGLVRVERNGKTVASAAVK